MSEAIEIEVRLKVFQSFMANAEKFPSVDDEGQEVPACWTEAMILCQLASQWIMSGKVPDDADWDKHEKAIQLGIATREATAATKN